VADQRRDDSAHSLELESLGLTLLGIMLSIGVTVAIGVQGPWWKRLLSGIATVVVLLALVGGLARPGRGPLARLARWLMRS
jgi:hypothetical protein